MDTRESSRENKDNIHNNSIELHGVKENRERVIITQSIPDTRKDKDVALKTI